MGGCLSCPERGLPPSCTNSGSSAGSGRAAGKAAPDADYWTDAATFCLDNLPLSLANAMEWYEYTAYSSMETYLSLVFFRGSGTVTWAVFGLTFVLRPFGGLLFGVAADLGGRRPAVLAALTAMCCATVGQGLAPAVPSLGPAWLMACRAVQGLATGGEMGSVAVILAEQAHPHLLGMSGFPVHAGCLLGFTLSNLVAVALLWALTPAQMLAWGWRLPFLLAAAPGVVAVYSVWVGMPETDDFQEMQKYAEDDLDWADQVMALQEFGVEGLVSVAGNATNFATTYLAGLYVTEWAVQWCGLTRGQSLLLSIVARVGAVGCCVPVGAAADRWGLGRVSVAVAAFGVATSVPMYALWYHFPGSMVVVVGVGIVLPALLQGSVMLWYPWTANLFPTQVRGTGVCLYFNVASSIGGLAPMLCSLSSSPLFPAYYSLGAAAASVLATAVAVALHQRYQAGGGGRCLSYLSPDLF